MIFTLLLSALFFIVNILLYPLNALITTFLPDFNAMLLAISNYLNLVFTYIGWAISVSGLPALVISLIVAFYTFLLTFPLIEWTFKTIVSWYNHLKP